MLTLPIDAALPALSATLREKPNAVLVAPPGAGKTTRVPLALLDEPWVAGRKLLLLEPRRLAARAAASRMAQTLGERVGETVGLRVRFGSLVSKATRVEVITEGVFSRMILDDPSLDGVAAVLFDEFHERSLDADMGLALALDAQSGLREDVRLLVMSATLDGARVAKLLGDAPVIESEGRAFAVETRYLGRDSRVFLEQAVAAAVERALQADEGSALVFLPGAGEIRRTERLLQERLLNARLRDPAVDIVSLYGALDAATQDRAIAPAPPGRRKVVLATSIAETSLTIEGVRIVVDSGVARVPRYEPDVGVTRLETVRVSRAAADQRRGRAGRTAPGVCYRLWDEPQTASLAAYAPPEVLSADLSGALLDLAEWGVRDVAQLKLLDAPPKPALAEARAMLERLGALDAEGRITETGRALRKLPLPPRLAALVRDAAANGQAVRGAQIAALLTERGLGGDDVDLVARLERFRTDRTSRSRDARALAQRWAKLAERSPRSSAEGSEISPNAHSAPSPLVGEGWGEGASYEELPLTRRASRVDLSHKGRGEESAALILARAFPDRIAKNRGNGAFLLANGRGATMDQASALSRAAFLAVGELTGTAQASRILLAAELSLAEIESDFAERVESRETVAFDIDSGSLRGRRARRLGAITLAEQPFAVPPGEAATAVLAAGVLAAGLDRLQWSKALAQFRDRVAFLRRAEGETWPDLSDAGLAARPDDWLIPLLDGKTALSQVAAGNLQDAVTNLLPWDLRRKLDTDAPTHFDAPSGSSVPIDYAGEQPTLAIRVQELFGLTAHPVIAGGRVPLVIELLSPAHRPVQVTRDLPGFWRGSYAAVKSEMKGRYPRHPWPDDPTNAPATRRAKPRS